MRIFVLITAALFIYGSVAHADSAWNENSLCMNIKADITGDGKPERIRLEPFVRIVAPDASSPYRETLHYFRLSVNDTFIYDASDWTGEAVSTMRLANIDKRDGVKEIVVRFPDGEWNVERIYWFDGKSIRRVTREPLMWISFPGDGRVLKRFYTGSPIIPQVTYDLQRDHTLRRRKQRYYKVRIDKTVKESFPIYSRPGIHRIAMLRPGTKVRILKSDLGDWLYVRAGRRTYGWMNQSWNDAHRAFGIVAAG